MPDLLHKKKWFFGLLVLRIDVFWSTLSSAYADVFDDLSGCNGSTLCTEYRWKHGQITNDVLLAYDPDVIIRRVIERTYVFHPSHIFGRVRTGYTVLLDIQGIYTICVCTRRNNLIHVVSYLYPIHPLNSLDVRLSGLRIEHVFLWEHLKYTAFCANANFGRLLR